MVPIINAMEKVNCSTTKTFRGNEANLPTRNVPFKTFIGSNFDKYNAG